MKPAVYFEEVETESPGANDNLSVGMNGNYKMMNTRSFDIIKFKVSEAPVFIPLSVLQNQNYKQQFPASVAPKSQPLPAIKKEQNKHLIIGGSQSFGYKFFRNQI